MRIAILGAGFTGLTAALRLVQQGHQVTLIEKETLAGGLAGGFKEKNWDWTLEKSYHHWFTNDNAALTLAKELDTKVIIKRPNTDMLIQGDIKPFDSASSLLSFPYLSPLQRVRTGLVTFYLKYLGNPKIFEGKNALPWLRKLMGKKVSEVIWEPLFIGKFGDLKENIALTWFWARIKKRTPKLAYPEGGFQNFADKIAAEIKKLGGQILTNTEVTLIKNDQKKSFVILVSEAHPESNKERFRTSRNDKKEMRSQQLAFDKVISTLPSPIFVKVASGLPQSYAERISSIPHLSSLNLILILKKPFFDKSYWLNINDINFPFLVLAEHTNFMDKKHYGNEHILYIGNYLPQNHPYLKMPAEELLKIYDPYLKKINPNYQLSTISYQLFSQPFAQPVVTPDYNKLIPEFTSPIKNVYMANMDMVYPWDRGTNYAIELGEKVVKVMLQ